MKRKNIDIILPVYNEKKSIKKVLNEWEKVLKKTKISHNFIICEDGSTDGTKELLSKIKNQYPIILSQKPYRRGYGPAVIDGIKLSNSEYVLCIDSDGQCDAKDVIKFWKKRDKNKVLIGWRVNRSDSRSRILYSKSFFLLLKLLFKCTIHDPSAPFVLFKKTKILPHLKLLNRMREGFWWGFVATCIKRNIELNEIQINHRNRIDGQTQVYHFKKIPSIALSNGVGLLKIKFAD